MALATGKSDEDVKPVTYTLPEASCATEIAKSPRAALGITPSTALPPMNVRAVICWGGASDGSSRATNTSLPAALVAWKTGVAVPAGKSAESVKPVRRNAPLASSATFAFSVVLADDPPR